MDDTGLAQYVPKQICENCFEIICQAYIFQQVLRESHTNLQKLLAEKLSNSIDSTHNTLETTIEFIEDDVIIKEEPEIESEIIHQHSEDISQEHIPEENVDFEMTCEELEETHDVPEDFSRELDRTIIAEPNISGIQCSRCLYKFKNESKLLKHQAMHEMHDNNICHICVIKLETESDFNIHMKNHDAEKQFTCLICGIKFKNRTSYNRHSRVTHNPINEERKKVLCDLCGKELKNEISLEIHMRTHTGEKPFHCDICKRSFIQKYSYSAHMKLHTLSDEVFECQICGKQFSRLLYLKKHLNIHSNYKPFQCHICDKSFREKQNYEVN